MSPTIANVIFWVAVACCAVAQLALLTSAIRSPMTGTDSAPLPMPRRASEVAWTILPAIALALLLIFTRRAMHTPPMTPDMPAGHRMLDE